MNFVKIYIFLTLLSALFFFKNKTEFKFVILLLTLALCNEIYSYILIAQDKSMVLSTNIYLLLHNLLWLCFLRTITRKLPIDITCVAFLIFGILNLIFGEGTATLNNNTFIIGALIYVVVFIFRSFAELKIENLAFFTVNKFYLLFAPVLFFIGLSFVFGFKSPALAQTVLWDDVTLYHAIITVVNFVYYSLINVYIYKEKRDKCLIM